MKINIITLGCSKNIVDSENIAGHLRKSGYSVYFDRQRNDCDIAIVNTCGFIGDAKEESVNLLLEQVSIKKRRRKPYTIIAVGCLVERYSDELKKEIPEIDAFYGVHQWGELIAWLDKQINLERGTESCCNFTDLRMQSTPRHYAYLKISEGCNRNCSYCAIPLIRGKHTSRPIDSLVAEARQLVENGAKEIIVIAQDTTYYGLDIYGKRMLGPLLDRLAEETGAQWIRLHYTYPASFPTDALESMASHSNICKYIDIPLQHINSRILNSMRRGIDREGTLELLLAMRKKIPDVAIRTTLIVGYPGETEEAFQELKEFVRQSRFDRMGAFVYSPEENTEAYSLGDTVDEETKQRRLDELMAVQEEIAIQKNEELIGKEIKVLIDRKEGGFFIGRSEYDSPEVDNEILVHSHPSLKTGEFYTVTVEDAVGHDLMAHVAK